MPTFLLKAVNIIFDILLEYIQRTLPYLVFGPQRKIRSRRSLIRIIGTNLPLPKAPRVCFNFATWRQNTLPEDDIPVKVEDNTLQQRKDPEEQKSIKKLEEELELLKTQVALILENQNKLTNISKNNEKAKPVCQPPPPPPPLPTFLLNDKNPIVLKSANRSSHSFEKKPAPIDAIITEMKNGFPKLKPIARSPGGRPLKPPSLLTNDPTDMLKEALKKRFNVSQYSDDSLSDLSISVLSDVQTF
ncbi:mitochondrial fission regulator 2-like [Cimex lectularius]|uniref:Mitochondrial fission regulator 2 n=1 Tax=Cimex lectularius TaxID=79782 RepID=A0A8I6RQS8_CIMLE|nr:mitochondrial fission regulator 2-like [Cimex lectularius]